MNKRRVPKSIRGFPGLMELAPDPGPGVYLLCLGVDVVYVGQSVSAYARMHNHRQWGKEFDRVFFIPCPRQKLNALESAMIHHIRPPLNGQHLNGEMRAPLPRPDARKVVTPERLAELMRRIGK